MSPEAHRTPVYEQIAEPIRASIMAGELADGDPLPSLAEIQREWGVTEPTARKSVRTLEAEGLVYARSGRQATVARAQEKPCPQWAATALGVDAGETIWMQVVDGEVILRTIGG